MMLIAFWRLTAPGGISLGIGEERKSACNSNHQFLGFGIWVYIHVWLNPC